MTDSLAIFCDGACRGNGRAGAKGGWAWAAWRQGAVGGAPLATGSAALPIGPKGESPTNQRAELLALLEALRWLVASKLSGATIYTDSMYAINCTSKWGPAWRRRGWKRDSGEPLQNLDLIQPLVAIWSTRWVLQHVAGHQTGSGWQAYGNNWVDRAAVVAATGGSSASGGTGTGSCYGSSTAALEAMLAPEPAPAPEPAVSSPLNKQTEHQPPQKKPHIIYKTNDIRSWFGGAQ